MANDDIKDICIDVGNTIKNLDKDDVIDLIVGATAIVNFVDRLKDSDFKRQRKTELLTLLDSLQHHYSDLKTRE